MHKYLSISAAALTALLLASGGAAVAAAAEPGDSVDVGVDVDIVAPTTPGALTMTVAPGRVTLAEDGSTDTVRRFTGSLPQVTVTDTRTPDQIPEGSSWYVLGSAGDFQAEGGASIGADHLGWSPRLVSGDDSVVSIGGDVDTSLDSDSPAGRGLVDQELLYLGDAASVPEGGVSSTATADLTLKVEPTVQAGKYSSVITLSLFE
ncbi:hypothetical protein ACF044_08370 [Microbacterium sp. NPDC016588]